MLRLEESLRSCRNITMLPPVISDDVIILIHSSSALRPDGADIKGVHLPVEIIPIISANIVFPVPGVGASKIAERHVAIDGSSNDRGDSPRRKSWQRRQYRPKGSHKEVRIVDEGRSSFRVILRRVRGN